MRARHGQWMVCLLVLVLAAPVASAGLRARPAAQSVASSGVPAGGPAVLYAPPPRILQLENHDARFKAPYDAVSGTEHYVSGEYMYTDYLYDDQNAHYPDDFARYGGNAADLMEFRMSTRGTGLAVRFSYTTLLVRDSTISVVAFDTDRNASTGSSTLPLDPGMPFPGTDEVLTSWGTGALWSTWTGTTWRGTPLASRVDLAANQITVTVPARVAHPTGKWAATLATGLYDPARHTWLEPSNAGDSKIINLGFRFDASQPANDPAGGQNIALLESKPTTFQHTLDFGLLRSGREWDNIPRRGYMIRMFASRLTKATYFKQVSDNVGVPETASEGRIKDGLPGPQYLSRLQPYAVYVPKAYKASRPAPLTFDLHGYDSDYTCETNNIIAEEGEARGSIVLAPSGRGRRGWYVDESEYDVFEAWNDVAHHFQLDPLRTALSGVSMGGYGAYRFSLRYPQLFSRAVGDVASVQRYVLPQNTNTGIWVPGLNDNATLTNRILDNARNVPIFHIADIASEATFYPATFSQTGGPALPGSQSLDSLGYRYLLWSVAEDHALGVALDNLPEITAFLGRHTIEPAPFHVTFTRAPEMDNARLGLVSDRAYWISDVTLRDARTRGNARVPGGTQAPPTGHVDAISYGFGLLDPTSELTRGAGATGDGLPYLSQERTWSSPGHVAPQDRIVIHAANVRSLTIDPAAAHVDCNVRIDITSDGPLTVHLEGCP